MKKLTYPLIAIVFAATAVQAQDAAPPAAQDSAQPATPQTAPDQSATPDAGLPDAQPQDAMSSAEPAAPPSAGAAASATVTDAEVSSYAEAVAKVQEIAKDATLADDAKQQQMASAVSAAGLEPQRFNEISQAVSTDAALRARVQTAMAAHSAASDG